MASNLGFVGQVPGPPRLALVCALLALAACHPAQDPPKDGALTAEGKAYVSNLKLSEVGMQATENYTGGVVTEILGKVTNSGDKTVEFAEVACVFYDSVNQLILREKAAIIKKPLKPGETRSFRLAFDDIPQSWNNQLPQLVIAQVRFA